MATEANEDARTYIVLVNHEEQYSLWLADREVPPGWKAVGQPGSRDECLAYVKEVWTDMRPLSLRGGAPAVTHSDAAHDAPVRIAYADGQPLQMGGEG